MANKTLTASGVVISGTSKRKIYHVVASATANFTVTFTTGGAGGDQVGPVIRGLANDTIEVSFPGGVLADYVTLSGAGINCWISYS